MPRVTDIAVASLVFSSFVLLVAVLLGYREWRDRRDRGQDLAPEDARHFAHQDVRRLFGIVVLVLLAIGLVAGSWVSPRLDHRANPRFVGIWLGVFLLIFVLLSLALRDWTALRHYARRHRNQILRDRLEILQDEVRRRQAAQDQDNGHTDGPIRDLFR